MPGGDLWAIEIKLGQYSRPERGFYLACEDVGAVRRFVVNPGDEHIQRGNGVEMVGLREMADILATLERKPVSLPTQTTKTAAGKVKKKAVAGLKVRNREFAVPGQSALPPE